MKITEHIAVFVQLGAFLEDFVAGRHQQIDSRLGKGTCDSFSEAVTEALARNHWFTRTSILQSMEAIAAGMLQPALLTAWLRTYPKLFQDAPKRVGIIMAGNIPLVGFHDLLCVLITGNHAVLKPSSKDKVLMEAVCGVLLKIDPKLEDSIRFSDRTMEGIDGLIATGSNNSARYFESTYSTIPRLVRKNRYSVAILTGKETREELQYLGKDIFDYYGLGCRNVSNLWVPEAYDFAPFLGAMDGYASVMDHADYADCYRYQKAVLELSDIPYQTNGFVLLREQPSSFSSIALLNYQKYTTFDSVKDVLVHQVDSIQCIVCKSNVLKASIPFGESQRPAVYDYADKVDTIEFILNLVTI